MSLPSRPRRGHHQPWDHARRRPAPPLRIPPVEDCAEKVRDDLIAAGCDREELFADDAERQPFAFHGLRHTCLTRWAVAGKGAQWLSAAGHTDLATTMGYVDVAVMLSGSFGQPHPPLPPSLLAEAADPELWRNYRNSRVRDGLSSRSHYANGVTPTGIEISNDDSRELSAGAVLADNSRKSLEEPLPFGPVGFRFGPRLGAGLRQPDGNADWAGGGALPGK